MYVRRDEDVFDVFPPEPGPFVRLGQSLEGAAPPLLWTWGFRWAPSEIPADRFPVHGGHSVALKAAPYGSGLRRGVEWFVSRYVDRYEGEWIP